MTLFKRELREALSIFYQPNDDHALQLLESLGDIMERYVMSDARRIDAEGVFPVESIKRLSDHGFCKISSLQIYTYLL